MEPTQEKNRISSVNIVFLVTVVISIVVGFLPLDFLEGKTALQLILSQAILVLPALVFMIRNKLPYKETVRFRKMKFADMALCILFGILLQPVLTFINALSLIFTKNSVNVMMVNIYEEVPFLVAVLLIAVLPAVLEETVYRGLFFGEYRKIDTWKAVLLSGVLFGIMHGNLNQFCYATVMGIVFALLIEATGSILSTMLIHFCTNAWSVVSIYLLPKMYEFIQYFHRLYKENGYEDLAAQIELMMGDISLPATEWLREMINASAKMELSIGSVVSMYGPQAVLMGYLAFLVYRKLAKRNGTWDGICEFFGQKKEDAEPIATIPLTLGAAIGVVSMFFYELALRIPR